MGNDSTLKISLMLVDALTVFNCSWLLCKARTPRTVSLQSSTKNLVKAKPKITKPESNVWWGSSKSYATYLKVSITMENDYDTGIYFHTHTSLA